MSDFFEGKWNEIKGQVRKMWGKLTDDDMAKMNGSFDQLSGRLQKTYGYGKDQAKKEIENFKNGLN